MKLVGLMPVRNEDWILGLSARVALQWCDALVIRVHGSTDRSWQIVEELKQEGVVIAINDEHDMWNEMHHRQSMLHFARLNGATHIAMIDADEILTANLLTKNDNAAGPQQGRPFIRSLVEGLGPGQMLELPGYNLRGSLQRYHCNGLWGERWFAVAFKDCPEANWQGDTFHHREPFGVQWRKVRPIQQGQGGVMHLWGASERRLTAKHALYKVTERIRYPDKPVIDIELMYNLWRSPADVRLWHNYPQGTWQFAQTPEAWWNHHLDEDEAMLDTGVPPWQEAEVKRLVDQYGRFNFAGLDLFGVA